MFSVDLFFSLILGGIRKVATFVGGYCIRWLPLWDPQLFTLWTGAVSTRQSFCGCGNIRQTVGWLVSVWIIQRRTVAGHTKRTTPIVPILINYPRRISSSLWRRRFATGRTLHLPLTVVLRSKTCIIIPVAGHEKSTAFFIVGTSTWHGCCCRKHGNKCRYS